MRTRIYFLSLLLSAGPVAAGETEFTTRSADGTAIHGVGATPERDWRGTAVVMVAGTGLFDRDAAFGRSGTPGDKLFRDLADRFVARGLAVVRYDRRGVRYGATTPAERLDPAVTGSSTVETQRDDLAAVRAWTESSQGLGARCVILFGHSEGVLHISRLAASGASAPLMVMGVGVPLRSPAEVVKWQSTERDAYSIELMDADKDGVTTNAEVEANWRQTPASAYDNLAPLLRPNGRWTAEDLARLRSVQATIYEQTRAATLAIDDAAPYPNAATPMAKYSWWKSWFTDQTAIADSLARWNVPMSLHWGAIDSQTPPHWEAPLAGSVLGARAKVTVHPRRGHTLGDHALYGPMDEAIANALADELAEAAASCR